MEVRQRHPQTFARDDTTSSVYAAVPTSDMSGAESFYEAVTGRPADSHPMPSLAQWEWGASVLQVVDDAERAGGGLVTVVVSDLAASASRMRARGVSIDVAEGSVVAQVAVLVDPDGNQVTLVEAR